VVAGNITTQPKQGRWANPMSSNLSFLLLSMIGPNFVAPLKEERQQQQLSLAFSATTLRSM